MVLENEKNYTLNICISFTVRPQEGVNRKSMITLNKTHDIVPIKSKSLLHEVNYHWFSFISKGIILDNNLNMQTHDYFLLCKVQTDVCGFVLTIKRVTILTRNVTILLYFI